MEALKEWILQNGQWAHWIVFVSILLAGANVPISTDIIILISALTAAQILPEQTWKLFFAVWAGCLLAAWISYWTGRLLSEKLQQWPFFSKTLSKERLEKVKKFYEKYGLWTLLAGRFIPFGVRNCIFMTTGMAKFSFLRFLFRDLIACTLWTSSYFFAFYLLGQNYEALSRSLKTFNLLIFLAFAIAVITFIWYKRRKFASLHKRRSEKI